MAARSPTCYTSSTLDINGSFAHGVLDDKLLFAKFFSQHLPIPQIVAVIERGEVFAQGGVTRDAGGVLDLAERHTSVVFKPSDSSRGRGIFRLNTNPETLNGRAVTDAEVDDFVRKLDHYLITETVQQAHYAETICLLTTNTVRVMTIIDP